MAEEVAERDGFRRRRLISKMKKYGLFQDLFFVDGEGFNPDLAICNKRFVTDFLGGVIER